VMIREQTSHNNNNWGGDWVVAPANGAGSGERLEKSTCKTLQRGLQGEFAGQEYSNGGGAKIFARAPPRSSRRNSDGQDAWRIAIPSRPIPAVTNRLPGRHRCIL